MFHKWTPEQIARGTRIRAAEKELMRAILDSAPDISENGVLTDLGILAGQRRQTALEMVNEAVMKANSAITFEAGDAGAEKTW